MNQSGLTIIARITAQPGDEAKLLASLREDERETLTKEFGCVSFEVLVRDGHPNQFVLYEVYRDEAAFETHKAEPHFAAFEDAVKRFGAGAPTIKLFNQVG
jgi:(4S)-4-hydroxy-5-phosphonooxypentane-2,3-dione isomerase